MKKLISLLLVVMMAALCFAACTPAPAGTDEPVADEPVADEPVADEPVADEPREKVLRINLSSEPAYLDPALNSSVDGACLAANSFGGLYTYDAEGNYAPNFATGYTVSEDGLTYVFTMREGLVWSDGTPLTAKDFVYSWNRVLDPATAADYSYMFGPLKSFEASEDGSTLTVVLNTPCAYMLDLMAFPTFYAVPQASVEAATDWQTNPGAWCQDAGFISSGAFICESWTHDESMVYVKNPNYWDAENVKIERLEFMLSADDTAILAAYNNGDLDFADTVPTDAIAGLIGNPEFHTVDELGTYYACFNVNSKLFDGKTPEQANAMRRAFALLVDRDYIVETVGQTGQKPATSFIPAGMVDGAGGVFKDAANWSYPVEDGYYSLERDVAGAIALLEEAGFVFTDGKLDPSTPISFEYLTNDTSGHIAVAECLQQDFGEIGIEMTIRSIDWATFLDERKAGNYDIARNGWIADFNDPVNMLEMWLTDSGNNDVQYGRNPENPATPAWTEFDALVNQIYAETDFAKRAELMHQAEDMLMETGALLPIYYYNDIYMMSESMTGFFSNVYGTKFFLYCDVA